MPQPIRAVRGTKDVLPQESGALRYLEQTALETAARYGYGVLRTPVFEYTALFSRGVGDETDIVQKEMYTFDDKGGRSVTLRPEGTAGAVRACLEHGLLTGALPCKVSYLTTCYRYDKPQAGRYREFEQFGCECFGAAGAQADAELLVMLCQYLQTVGAENFTLQINSIGCPDCRERYATALNAFFANKLDGMCETCKARFTHNPLRLLDCKSPVCKAAATEAPLILDYICEGCATHFAALQARLTATDVPFIVNPRIVRGLDYYTRTVFEVVSDAGETKGLALAAGGRYDNLVAQLGGPSTPALGFGVGLERVWLAAKNSGAQFPEDASCELYIAPANSAAAETAAVLAKDVRACGWNVVTDLMERSLKAQMKYADKISAPYVLTLGESELQTGKAKLRNMRGGAEADVLLSDFAEQFDRIMLDEAQAALVDAFGDTREETTHEG
jgi:histidyl-tRNA synthetase